jgi:glycerophosphoryl diester phosphodiesterase
MLPWKEIILNIELKIDRDGEAHYLPLSNYVNEIVLIIQSKRLLKQIIIQSFDWRTIAGIYAKWPKILNICLIGTTQVKKANVGFHLWLVGLNLDDFDGNWVAAAHALSCVGVVPAHGSPSTKTPNSPTYNPSRYQSQSR